MDSENFHLSRAKVFLYSCVSFIIGIALAGFIPESILAISLLWFGVSNYLIVCLIIIWPNKKLRLVGFIGLFFFLGIWRFSLSIPTNTLDKIWFYNGETVEVEGIIISEPDLRETNTKLKVESKKVLLKREDLAVKGKVLVTTNLYPKYQYGDLIKFTCELKEPEMFNGFAYDKYLARHDIFSVCYYPRIIKLDQGQGNIIYSSIYKLKNKLRANFSRGLNEPGAGVVRAIVLGDKQGISAELKQVFSKAGISHIVAISGMHISIISAMVMLVLLQLGLTRKLAFYLATVFLIFYVILIGLPPSALRAAFMGFLVLLALQSGRLNSITNSIVLAATILLVFNPRLFWDDIGWQLSFLAVMGIVYGFPILEAGRKKILPKLNSKIVKSALGIISVSLVAQLATWPIIANNFGTISLIAPLTNLLILWCLPIVIGLATLGILLTAIFPVFSRLIFMPLELMINYIVFVSEKLSLLPFSWFEADINAGISIVYYFLLFFIYRFIKRLFNKSLKKFA
ncbi:ComEC family competence protein [Candidatus Parcubacteria bacterium]|nr:ComEC family competence protein [Candidatus Parcubacteria bacterium]